MKRIIFLAVAEVLLLHELAIERFGGASGLRDKGLLESAVAQPSLFIFGEYVYPDIFHMAAAYCFHIIKNHPFVDGNKRTGILTALTFLEKNGIKIETDADSLYNVALEAAQSSLDKEQIAQFFKQSAKKIS